MSTRLRFLSQDRDAPDGPLRLPPHFEFRGELTAHGPLLIDSAFEGKLISREHTITIAATAEVTADIEARSVVILGSVEGTVRALERIEVADAAWVRGDLYAPRVQLADGCRIVGRINPNRRVRRHAPAPTVSTL